jgi:hypothetical protein
MKQGDSFLEKLQPLDDAIQLQMYNVNFLKE